MNVAGIDLEKEKKEILRRYSAILRALGDKADKQERALIRKAFDLALDAHKDMRRKSGEPYIYHPIAVAQITVSEMGLGATAVICALLHDTVEDTDVTLEDIRSMFGETEAKIIDGLTKIENVFDQSSSIQAENFRKVLLTLSDDVRVILIKLADRLHNMRTLDSMRRDKQLKIASETLFLYAPLAHRLGLYSIKTEMEDLGLMYTEPDVYEEIITKLKNTEEVRRRFISRFIHPIRNSLNEQGFQFDIKGRPKSIYSIYNKIKVKGIPFEEIFDIFAIRIIIDSPPETEKADCWRVYSIITDIYQPSPDRLRDWISTPRANGYESLHTTVMSPTGKWVEVQIRSSRMDEIAEKGLAAHWRYKEHDDAESGIDEWLHKIREMLDHSDSNALEFINDFKLNLFSEEIFVFTPKGELKTLPSGSSALDFAFDIHSEVGMSCIGAKVNNKLVPLSHKLKSGDQIEILSSSKQKPKEDWLNFVVTAKARSKIKSSLKEEKRQIADVGKEILEKKLKSAKVAMDQNAINNLIKHFKLPSALDLFYSIGEGIIKPDNIQKYARGEQDSWYKLLRNRFKRSGSDVSEDKPVTLENIVQEVRGKSDMLVIGEDMQKIDYKLATCCNPIPGDEVFGFVTINDGIKIHKTNCPNAISLMSNYAYRIVKARWMNQQQIAFMAGIRVDGIDDVGIVNNITRIISNELNVNMRSISFDSHDGVFEGNIMVFVHDTHHLTELMQKIREVKGVTAVSRVDSK
ncbi:MAG: bifunctional (p)ppGpp synthetase/guanosine-3',5'-bis(diphosphate) 3'-pyrophosphohydrolase [Bacteroidetes bacterium]|nr:bifunctional (p)ppGpp synthetase/guanosine-3',5'-bis(diphosphate) 3'-pyrophosphohydrolase [Bacteroidota bacterium]